MKDAVKFCVIKIPGHAARQGSFRRGLGVTEESTTESGSGGKNEGGGGWPVAGAAGTREKAASRPHVGGFREMNFTDG